MAIEPRRLTVVDEVEVPAPPAQPPPEPMSSLSLQQVVLLQDRLEKLLAQQAGANSQAIAILGTVAKALSESVLRTLFPLLGLGGGFALLRSVVAEPSPLQLSGFALWALFVIGIILVRK